jgi:hypothetical protein
MHCLQQLLFVAHVFKQVHDNCCVTSANTSTHIIHTIHLSQSPTHNEFTREKYKQHTYSAGSGDSASAPLLRSTSCLGCPAHKVEKPDLKYRADNRCSHLCCGQVAHNLYMASPFHALLQQRLQICLHLFDRDSGHVDVVRHSASVRSTGSAVKSHPNELSLL